MLIYLFPYWISCLISLGVALYAWQQRRVTGAVAFAGFVLAQASWTLFYTFELAGAELRQKLLWDNVQWIFTLIAPLVLLHFSILYLEIHIPRPALVWSLLTLPAVVFTLHFFTYDPQQLTDGTFQLIAGEPFDTLYYDYTTVMWIAMGYAYCLSASGVVLLALRLPKTQGIQRVQLTTIVVGVFIPIGGVLAAQIFDLKLARQRDISPLLFALGNGVTAWGLFRYRLFDLVPIARDMVIEHMDDGMVVVDMSNRVLDLNQSARKGTTVANPIGLLLEQVYPAWKADIDRLRQVERAHIDLHATRDGINLDLEMRISPICDRSGKTVGRLIITHNISERVRAQKAARQHQLELELERERTRLLTEFIQHVAHEFRTPLATINTAGYLLTRLTDPEQKQTQAATIETATRALANLLDKMLDMMRLDHVTAISPGQVSVNQLLKIVIESYAAEITRKQLHVEQHLASDLPVIPGDMDKLYLAFANLFENAVRFTPEGGSITVATGFDDQQVSITISDTGIGMNEEVQQHIFERFYQADDAHSTRGFGLGLSIAHRAVELHRGHIMVDSALNQGTTFTISLPCN